MMDKILLIMMSILTLWSCDDVPTPKPKALLRLEYPQSDYAPMETKDINRYSFQSNHRAKLIKSKKEGDLRIYYPEMRATIYINYMPVKSNIRKLLEDAQKFTYEHVIKAKDIVEQPYVDQDHNVYGMYYNISGNAASQTQFYLTDSIHNFIKGSLYFYAKPNYDSIYPAVDYINKDIRKLIETLRWE